MDTLIGQTSQLCDSPKIAFPIAIIHSEPSRGNNFYTEDKMTGPRHVHYSDVTSWYIAVAKCVQGNKTNLIYGYAMRVSSQSESQPHQVEVNRSLSGKAFFTFGVSCTHMLIGICTCKPPCTRCACLTREGVPNRERKTSLPS